MTNDYNIILINIDGFRRDRISHCPTLENLVENSLYFSEMNTVAPYTFASLHSIFSGVYPSKNGVNGYYNIFKFKKNDITTITELLQKNEYYTSCDLIDESVVPNQGFDEVNVFDEKTVDFKKRHSELINKLSNKNKFFLFLHYTETHKHLVNDVIQKYKKQSTDSEYFLKKKENSERYNSYMPMCDSYIKSIIESLKQNNIFNKTILIIFADHGTSLGEKIGEKFYGVFLYDYTLNVFCIVNIPGWDKKLISKQCSTLDIYPTILELGNISDDFIQTLDGKSLLNFVKNSNEEEREIIAETGGLYGPWPSPTSHNVFCIKSDSKKLIYNKTPNSWEFYNLKQDPQEITNIYDNESNEIQKFQKKLKNFLEENSYY